MDIFQILASSASIISIPLAIYYARKNNNTTSEKARLDIIKTLSYRLSAVHTLTHEDIDSVYKSKLREHEIVHTNFNQEDILNDLKTDIMSNAFLENEIRNKILYNLSTIEFIHNETLLNNTPKFLIPFIKFFVSPIPYILLIANAIVCVILLFPYIFNIIYCCVTWDRHRYELLEHIFRVINDIFFSPFLSIALICLLTLSVICFFRKKYIKKQF